MPSASPRIVVAAALDSIAVERLRRVGEVVCIDPSDKGQLLEAVRDCEALVVHTATPVTRALLEQAPRLRVIGRAGVGLETIDLDAARQRGVTVVYTPGATTGAVAELTIGLMVAVLRRIPTGDAMVRAGKFSEARDICIGTELAGTTLGVIGLGRIGKAVARRCHHGLGMHILYNDLADSGSLDFPAMPADKGGIYQRADVISLHVPLTDRTRRMIDAEALATFKPTAYLVNTARGAVVDSDALASALCDGRIAGAALDVVDPEPLPAWHALLSAPNVVFSPHIGSRTRLGMTRRNEVVDDVIAVLQGRAPRHPA